VIHTSRLSVAVGVAFACATVVGCGGTYDASVTGKVTLDGNLVPRGTVSFSPSSGTGSSAFGMIDGDGNYVLRTGREEGLPAGQYSVSVVASEPSPPRGANGGPPPLGKMITPLWYRDIATSGLSYTVTAGSNEINLELNSKPPAGWKPPAPGRR
jgi:hypothetical protein